MVVVYASAGALKITREPPPVVFPLALVVQRGDASLGSVIMCLTLLSRFARHAVVTSSDQIHLRLSCPPFC